jgi:hypothetical protein
VGPIKRDSFGFGRMASERHAWVVLGEQDANVPCAPDPARDLDLVGLAL